MKSSRVPAEGECWLYRRRSIALFALAFWIYAFIHGVLRLSGAGAPHVVRGRLVALIYFVGIWLFGSLAKSCKRPLERSFYLIGLVPFVVLGACAVSPLSESGIWALLLLNAVFSAIEIVLSGAIVLWHFRTRMDRSDSISS